MGSLAILLSSVVAGPKSSTRRGRSPISSPGPKWPAPDEPCRIEEVSAYQERAGWGTQRQKSDLAAAREMRSPSGRRLIRTGTCRILFRMSCCDAGSLLSFMPRAQRGLACARRCRACACVLTGAIRSLATAKHQRALAVILLRVMTTEHVDSESAGCCPMGDDRERIECRSPTSSMKRVATYV